MKCELVTLSWSGNIKNLYYVSSDGLKTMNVYESGFNIPEEYKGPPTIAFYTDQAVAAMPPEKRPPPVGIAKLPATGGSVLLLFTPVPDSPGKLDVKVIDNALAGFPLGAYRVFNLDPKPVLIATDRTVHPAIGPQRLAILKPASGDPVRDMDVRIAVNGKEIYSSSWGHRENRRTTVFISPDPRGHDQLLIRKFFQIFTPPPAQP